MYNSSPLDPVDYLLIGHLVVENTPLGPRWGGPAAYAGLTAQRLGFRVGIVSVWGQELTLEPLQDLTLTGRTFERSTTFEYADPFQNQIQILHHVAPPIENLLIPDSWRSAENR